MNVATDVFRIIYGSIFSHPLWIRLRVNIFDFLRTSNLINILERSGFLVCKQYIQIHLVNPTQHINVYNTETHQVIEKDVLHVTNCLDKTELCKICSTSVETKTLIIDAINSNITCRNNHLVDGNLNLIGGYQTPFDNFPIFAQRLERTIPLKGTVAYLSDPEPTNYYHWMCGTLPLLRFYQQFFDIQDIDHFYIGQFPLKSFHQDSLNRAGIPLDRVVQHGCTADRVLAAISSRFVDLNDPISQAAYRFSRNLFQDVWSVTPQPRCRIYVSRGNTQRRRVLNESQVIEMLAHYEFEPVQMDGKSIAEQAALFASAEAIVAPHGAALTNLLFIHPGTHVVEIFPHGYTNNCFYVLANYGKANYFCLKGESIQQAKQPANNLDIEVDIQKLQTVCEAIFSPAHSRR